MGAGAGVGEGVACPSPRTPGPLGSGSRAGWQEAPFAFRWVVFVQTGQRAQAGRVVAEDTWGHGVLMLSCCPPPASPPQHV